MILRTSTPILRCSRGFTILELMVTVVLMGILLAFASLHSPSFLAQHRLNRAARQVATDLRLARTKAVSQTWRYRVVFPSGGAGYDVERDDGAGGWSPHALYGKTLTVAASQPIGLPNPVTSSNAQTVVFWPRGNVTAPVTVSLRDPGLPGVTRTVRVSFAGQVSIQ